MERPGRLDIHARLTVAVRLDVARGSAQAGGVVPKRAKADVAQVAKQGPDLAGGVTVVYVGAASAN